MRKRKMILDELNYLSEEGLQQDPEYPEICRITLQDLAQLEECPICHRKTLTSRDKQLQPRKIYDYDTKNKKVVIMTIYRKNYRCTKCKRSFTANDQLNSIRRTKEFEHYIALKTIKECEFGMNKDRNGKGSQWSNEVFAQRYGYHRDTISKIAKAHAPALTPLLIPPTGFEYFFLYTFEYDQRTRYYLMASKAGKNSMLLAVFGYKDAFLELQTYLNLHKSFIRYETATFYTDFDAKLINLLKEYAKTIKINFELFKKKLDQYEIDLKRKPINAETLRVIGSPFETLKNVITLKNENLSEEHLFEWWDKVQKTDKSEGSEFEKYLSVFRKEIDDCMIELLQVDTKDKTFINQIFYNKKLVDAQIENYASKRSDFTLMAAKIMLHSEEQILNLYGGLYVYTSDIFTDNEKWTYYSQEVLKPIEPLEVHCFMELINDNFNPTDMTYMMLDDFWKHYDDGLPAKSTDELNLTGFDVDLENSYIPSDDEQNSL